MLETNRERRSPRSRKTPLANIAITFRDMSGAYFSSLAVTASSLPDAYLDSASFCGSRAFLQPEA